MVVKELIQSNLNGRTIDDKSTHFLYFFDVFENIIDHGIKSNWIKLNCIINFILKPKPI